MQQISCLHILLIAGVVTISKSSVSEKLQTGKVEGSDVSRHRRDTGNAFEADAASQLLDDILHGAQKRPFGPLLSGRILGKRNRIEGVRFNRMANEPVFEENRRAVGDIAGDEFKFGSSYGPEKRPFGNVLGGGFKLGNSFKMGKKSFGHVIGGGFRLGKLFRSGKKSFGNVLGGGFRLGNPFVILPKRDAVDDDLYRYERGLGNENGDWDEERQGVFDDMGAEKRIFGNVLGGGFKLGKRPSLLKPESSNSDYQNKRSFGHILGGGLKLGSGFGKWKRQSSDWGDNTSGMRGISQQYLDSSSHFMDGLQQAPFQPFTFGSESRLSRPDDLYEAL